MSLTLGRLLAPYAGAEQMPQPEQPPWSQDELNRQVDEEGRAAAEFGAGVTNDFLIPGRIVTCTLGSVVGVLALILTLGSAYRAASAAVREGCGGKWTVTGEDLRPQSPGIQATQSYSAP